VITHEINWRNDRCFWKLITCNLNFQELVREVDPNEQLDEEVEDLLLHIADDFIEQTVMASCALAKHRKANSVDVKDVQLVLERNWNMWIPGFGTEDVRPYRKSATTEAHKARMALIRKALKKYWFCFKHNVNLHLIN
jgi:transcription initiation factor TFIID subunit 12